MNNKIKYIIFGAFIVLLGSSALYNVKSQPRMMRCDSSDKIYKGLFKFYGEKRRTLFVHNSKTMFETFVSKTGTWTLVKTTDKMSCLLASGKNWVGVPEDKSDGST